MNYVVGAVIGLLWGALVAWVNSRISASAIRKNSTRAVMLSNFARTVIDIAALGLVFLLRNILPGSFEATIIGTAASLGMLTVVFAFLLAKPEKMTKTQGSDAAVAIDTAAAASAGEAPDAADQSGEKDAHV